MTRIKLRMRSRVQSACVYRRVTCERMLVTDVPKRLEKITGLRPALPFWHSHSARLKGERSRGPSLPLRRENIEGKKKTKTTDVLVVVGAVDQVAEEAPVDDLRQLVSALLRRLHCLGPRDQGQTKAGDWIPLKYWTSEVRAELKSLEHTCSKPATVKRKIGNRQKI
ncbi:hypothetical protein EYF80_026146 [Liparis tanakae]|uniref:Uncharacterized protein n=1 Tax=Liparis tanakae TaxID=230148 RepID=A0A4Z2HDK3_9TELE|nr:hypothetical protein EYF80_026146 [Liparis tanakae]